MRRGMNSMEMQKNNRILVFKTLQEKGMMTRAELAVELNLQKATITNIMQAIVQDCQRIQKTQGNSTFLGSFLFVKI